MTDPRNPRYCMVFTGSPHEASDPPRFQPMSAKECVGIYHPHTYQPEEGSILETAIEDEQGWPRMACRALERVPLIDSATLSEAFPLEGDINKWTNGPRMDYLPGSSGPTLPATPEVPSLITITARKIIKEVISNPLRSIDGVEFLLQILLDVPTMKFLQSDLSECPQIPSCVLPLLAKILTQYSKEQGVVDISPFVLSADQVMQLVLAVSSCQFLKIGIHNQLTIDQLNTIAKSIPYLKALVLFDKNISVDEIDSLRSNCPSHLLIAHKPSYFTYLRDKYTFYTQRLAEQEFVFLLQDTWALRRPNVGSGRGRRLEGAGNRKILDPNFIIRALHDIVSAIWARGGYERQTTLSQACFGAGDRTYDTPFESSSLIDLAPKPKLPSQVTKWMFILRAGRQNSHDWPVLYGFAQVEAGSVIEVTDLEGFAKTLQSERPDLPKIIGYDGKQSDTTGSFYQALRWLLGASDPLANASAVSFMGEAMRRLPCRLVTTSNVEEAIASFIS